MYEKGGPETNPGFGVSFKRNDNVVVTRNNVVNKPSPWNQFLYKDVVQVVK